MKKITISIPDEIADKADRAVNAGQAASVSAYFTTLARREPDWAAAGQLMGRLGVEAGVTQEDLDWADSLLDQGEAEAAADGVDSAA